jgi:hypothetical protein
MAELITDLTDADIRTEWRTNVAILDQGDDDTDGGDSDGTDGGDSDGTDGGDSDGTDGAETDGTDA